MSPSLSTNPAEATTSEALAIIRSEWTPTLKMIVRGQYSFWVGSAISSSRFEPLRALLERLLIVLQSRCDGSGDCPYRKALEQILERASLNSTECAGIDLTRTPTSWPQLADIVRRLEFHYSTVLGVPVLDPGPLSIPWDVLKLQDVYGDTSKQPDAEHRCLSVMVEEAFISNLVTTNWDPLIEKAYKTCRAGRAEELEVVASNDDLDRGGNGGAPRLFKIHGCAQRAVADPKHYLPFMVATVDELAKWATSSKPLAEASRALLREGPSLFVGLSGQDFNLKTVFAEVEAGRDEPYPVSPSRVVFCATDLSPDQHAILKLIYGDAAYSANAKSIVKAATLPLYAKPLLGAIYFLGIKAKILALLAKGSSEIATPFMDMAIAVCESAEERLCSIFDPIAPADERWRAWTDGISRFVGRVMALYHKQELASDQDAYEPLSSFNVGKIESLSAAQTGNLHWLLLALSCVLEGERRGYWKVEVPLRGVASEGQLVLRDGGSAVSVFLLDRVIYRSRLERNILNLSPSPNAVVVVYPVDCLPSVSARFPTRALPGASYDPDEITEISLQEMLEGTTTTDVLLDAFRKELLTARKPW